MTTIRDLAQMKMLSSEPRRYVTYQGRRLYVVAIYGTVGGNVYAHCKNASGVGTKLYLPEETIVNEEN